MKRSTRQPFQSRRNGRRSAALIVILGCMVILAVVLLAFLSSAKTELVSSKMYSDNNDVHTLMNTCANIVMAQIRQATTATPTDIWTSQPGLIRTFNNSGAPDMSYKLYSSDIMQTNVALNPATEAATLASWSTQPAVFTDLNDPVAGVYPIVDPALANGVANGIQGFTISGTAPLATGNSANPAPMPVKWLYILHDGSMVAPVATGTGTTATVAGATASNPIVGRVAFWTDDETCKVNINTASEGSYWDVPRFNNTNEVNFGLYQPVQNEYQNYPGHPAGVNLSAVFPSLLVSGTASNSMYNPYYALAPRIQSGGSLNNTVPATITLSPVTLDADRLYDSADELLFNTNRTSNPSTGAPNISTASALTQTQVEQAKFFITAHSRSPELTPFGTPKVACWPINAAMATTPSTPLASAFDRLIGLCSTLNGSLYYFQRQNKDSPTNDYANIPRNQTLYSYLHTLMNTQIPGFGGNLGTKFGADSDQILTEIFDYIRCANLNDLNLGTANQFAPGTPQTPTYLYGQGEVTPITIGSTRGFGRYLTVNEVGLWLICTGDPAVPASNVTGNLTLDASGTLTATGTTTKQIRIEAAVVIDPFTPMHAAVPIRPDVDILISGLDSWTIQGDSDGAAINFGFPSKARQINTDAGIFQLGIPPDWIGSGNNAGGYMGTTWPLSIRQVRARNSNRLVIDGKFLTGHTDSANIQNEQYPFVSEPVTVNVKQTGSTLTFSGGQITLTIRQSNSSAGPGNPGPTIQTLTINFPQMTMPAPVLTATGTWTFQAGGCGVGSSPNAGRFTAAAPSVDTGNDIMYSMVAAASGQTLDPRFLAMLDPAADSANPGALFSKHPWCDGTHRMANTFIPYTGSGNSFTKDGSATSAPNGTNSLANIGSGHYYPFRFVPCPKVPYPAPDAIANGDWDNGLSNLPDGGFLNEPDQSDINNTYATPYYNDHFTGTTVTTFTSPSRMIPSPGMFGSLPVTFARSKAAGFTGTGHQGWQTLLFRRQPTHPEYVDSGSTATKGVGGFSNAPDYLMMDLFWMPVVEPYAISETLSTAGKINMNYQIVPFSYIKRQTGLYAVLDNEKVISVPTSDYNGVYKNTYQTISATANYRRPIQIAPTLTQFDFRFNNSDGTGLYAFRTPSEICDIHLIPDDASPSTASKSAMDTDMASYWSTHTLTGDNSREHPYTTIYPRLTTRSNTFRVHYRVQALKKFPNSDAGTWTEGTDLVTSEGRGSVLIERYLDTNDTTIPDYAANPTTTPTLESRYQFRVVSVNRFPP